MQRAVGVERGSDRVNRPHTLWISTVALLVAAVACSDDDPGSTAATGSDGTGAGSATTGSGGIGGGGTTGTMHLPSDGGGGNGGNGGGAGGNICEGSDAPECPKGIESCGTPDLPECPPYAFCITCCCLLQAAN